MAILDLHCSYDATGSTDTVVNESNANAVVPAGDGATTKGLSPWPGAVLLSYGGIVNAAATAFVNIGITSNNIVDPTNLLADTATGTDTRIIVTKQCQMGYANGPNFVTYANEAAGPTAVYKLDYLSNVGASGAGSIFPTNVAEYSVTFGAATAGTYQTLAFAPTNAPPVGTYDILGARISNATFGAILRFQHTDFGGAFPGFPLASYSDQALTVAGYGGNLLTSDAWQGYQFVQLGKELNKPVCPRFRIQGQGTGLVLQLMVAVATTATVSLILQKVA